MTTSVSHSKFLSRNSMQMSMMSTPKVVSDINGNTIPIDSLPDDVANALTKDYSALMKAIDAKKSKIFLKLLLVSSEKSSFCFFRRIS